VRSLAEMGSRYPGTDGHRRAGLYLEQELRRLGAGVVGRGPRGSGVREHNVFVAFGPGAAGVTNGGPIDVVLGAHYDSIADRTPGWRSQSDPAPGANDNGTGVAGLLEIARIIAEEEKAGRLRRGVAVVFFDREETRMEGSLLWVRQPGGAGRVMLNLDMVGFSAPGRKKLDVVRYASSGDLLDRVRAANERYGLGLQLVDRLLPMDLSTWVDSTPFAMAGVPAVSLTESYGQPGIDYPGYPGFHRVSDTPDQINNEAQWRSATQLVLALALELSR
jgi:Zn-dependent M28 family amino/carboxypeptidase